MEADEEVDKSQSADEDAAILCQPCKKDREELEAEGYCQTCNEYLCQDCFKGHTLPSICRNHVMLDKSQMPPKSLNYKEITKRLDILKSDVDNNTKNTSEIATLTEELIDAYVENFKAFRKNIEDHLKSGEEGLINLAAEVKQENKKSSDDLLNDLQTMKNDINESTSKFESLENDTSGLNDASSKLSELEKSFEAKMTKDKLPEYQFKRKETIQRLLSFNVGLGKLERIFMTTEGQKFVPQPQDFTTLEPTRLPGIDVKTDDDEGTKARITGIVFLPPSTLLLADNHNEKVKVMDAKTHKIVSELTLPDSPWDITLLPGNVEAALSMPEIKRIQYITLPAPLSKLRTVKLRGKCYGIRSTSERMIVSLVEPHAILVMNLRGNVVFTTINSDEILYYPFYIDVAREVKGEFIYVSNRVSKDITKLTMEGKVVSETTHADWDYLNAVLAFGNNQLLVCNDNGNTVDIVRESGEVVTLLNDEEHGIKGADSILYSNGTLYVGAGICSSESFLAFKLAPKQKQADN